MTTSLNFLRIAFAFSFALMGFTPSSRANSFSGDPEESHKAVWLSRQTVESVPPPQQIMLGDSINQGQEININSDDRLSFQTYRNSNWDIYTIPGVSETIGPIESYYWHSDISPDVRPGGYRTAYASNAHDYYSKFQIYSSFSDGLDVQRLTSEGDNYTPAWSTDASKISFVSNRTGVQQIYVMSANGENQRCLSCDSTLPSWSPTWSPSGDQIAFVKPIENTYTGKIYSVPSAGGIPQVLQSTAWKYLGNVRWSPGGDWVAFDAALGEGEWNRLIVINVHTGEARPVYDPGQEYVDAWMGDWSTDGQKLIFTRVEYVQGSNPLQIRNTYIEEVPWTGGQPTRINTGSNTDRNPSVQKRTDFTPPTARVLPFSSEYIQIPDYQQIISIVTNDEGGAGSSPETTQVQLRVEGEVVWKDVSHNLLNEQILPLMGKRAFFRARARDHEGNLGNWTSNPDGDTYVIFYYRDASFNVKDNRGHPIQKVSYSFDPRLANHLDEQWISGSGFLAGKLSSNVLQTVTISAPGFYTLTQVLAPGFEFLNYPFSMSPLSNQIINGSFELGITNSWQATGSFLPYKTTDYAFEGRFSLAIPNGPPTVDLPRYYYNDISNYKTASIDMNGIAHFMLGGCTLDKLCFSDKQPDEEWRPPTPFMDLVFGERISQALFDNLGNGHFITSTWLNEGLFYCFKPAFTSECSEKSIVTSGSIGQSRAVIDAQNILHVIWEENNHIYYRSRSLVGGWENREIAVQPTNTLNPELIGIIGFDVNFAGESFVLFSETKDWNTKFKFVTRNKEGLWDTSELVGDSSAYGSYIPIKCPITSSPNGDVYAIPQCNLQNYVFVRKANSSIWITQTLPSHGYPGLLKADKNGDIHFASSGTFLTDYWVKPFNQNEWVEVNVNNLKWIDHNVPANVDDSGNITAIVSNISYAKESITKFHYSKLDNLVPGHIQQRVFIPENMHRPTLQFSFKQSGAVLPLMQAYVSIQSPMRVFNSNFELAYLDSNISSIALDEFKNEPVTLTFGVITPSIFSLNQLLIDHVSLGGWETPTMLDVTPTRVPNPEQTTTLTITGENFFGSPVVRARNVPASSVTLVNENTIQATWNGTLPVGLLTVEVENPGGALALMDRAVLSGNPAYVYLPLLSR